MNRSSLFCLLYFVIMLHGTKMISIPFKSLIKIKIYFVFPSGQDVLRLPQWNGCGPSLVNEACVVSARHPGSSFPVCQPWEAVSHWPMTIFPPSLSWSTPFVAHRKQGSGWWHYPSDVHQGIDVCITKGLSYVLPLQGSTGWFAFGFFLLSLLDLFWFPRFKCFD